MNKPCSKCGNHPALSYHAYCYGCLRESRGQSSKPKFRRDSENKTLCSRCKKNPRAPSHNYCTECRNKAVRKWEKKQGGTWAYITADPLRHKKALARKLIYNKVYRGQMQKTSCEICGDPVVQAHHDDYDRPLDVRWLCQKHHEEADAKKELVDANQK